MYRKHLKMARGEGEVESKGLKSHFVERVVKLPMVHVAWDYASTTYSHIKESNKLVNFTLTNAEKSVTFVAGQAKPVVLKFEKQIQAVDDLACKGLGTLEEKVPFITKPAEEIIDDTRKLYASTVYSRFNGIRKYGNDKVKYVTDYGLQKANDILGSRLVQSVMTSVDGALVVTENYIDHILPPLDEENQNNVHDEKHDEKQNGLVRLALLSGRIRHRAYRNLVIKLEYAQERSVELLLTYPIEVIEFSKGHLDAAVEFANRVWLTIKQEESEAQDTTEKSPVEQQLLHLTRLVTRQLAKAYTTAANILPLPLNPTSETDSTGNTEQSHPVSHGVIKERALWVFGLLRLVPSLLPMYLYGFATWLEERRNGTNKKIKESKTNGTASVSNHNANSTNHVIDKTERQNNIQENNGSEDFSRENSEQ